jgi:L-rhamnose mutarotase
MLRKAFVLRLKPGALEDYIHWHNNMYPELKAEFVKQGIADITLFHVDDKIVLFSHVTDEGSWTRLWDSAIHHRWAKELMEPLMHYRDDGIVDAAEMREIWRFEKS